MKCDDEPLKGNGDAIKGDGGELNGDGEELQGNGKISLLMYLHNFKMKISLCILSRFDTYCQRKWIVSFKNDNNTFIRDVKGQ